MLELKSLSKSFGEKRVLDDISASFGNGITGIAGANGCGKTTMLKILTGLLKPEGGKVFYNSKEINTQSALWRSKIGYLPQAIGLYN
ncbi:MAG: ATP-binding cassette domain-containing protein, partial [Bacteroidota bacterium]